jgi:DNA-binding response OmpR family regulator
MILELENKFEIDTATSVDDAFFKLQTQSYDAIVCDYEMPIKNGLDFLKELREQENNIAFIVFTGRGREEVAIRALNLGADHYINKNSSPEAVYSELANAIRKIVESKKEARSIRGKTCAT